MSMEKSINRDTEKPTGQRLCLEDRENITLSGVENVDNFSDNEIVLITNMGKLTVKGENLHINKINVDTGDFSAKGSVISLIYSKATAKRVSFLDRLFK